MVGTYGDFPNLYKGVSFAITNTEPWLLLVPSSTFSVKPVITGEPCILKATHESGSNEA